MAVGAGRFPKMGGIVSGSVLIFTMRSAAGVELSKHGVCLCLGNSLRSVVSEIRGEEVHCG